MLFTPCEICGTLLNDKQFDRALIVTEKLLDRACPICDKCISQLEKKDIKNVIEE